MTFGAILGFALAMSILAIVPGPAFFVLINRAMSNGVVAGAGVLLGIILADLVYLNLALMGMSAISQAMGSFFVIIKIIGGLYIIWLGIKLWRQKPMASVEMGARVQQGFFKSFLEGLAVNLTNPKAIVFFAALLPTFVDVTSVTVMDGIILAGIVVLASIIIDGSYIMLAHRAARFFKSEKAQVRLNRIGGATLGAVGAAVISR